VPVGDDCLAHCRIRRQVCQQRSGFALRNCARHALLLAAMRAKRFEQALLGFRTEAPQFPQAAAFQRTREIGRAVDPQFFAKRVDALRPEARDVQQ
jgi:hypothetical protein